MNQQQHAKVERFLKLGYSHSDILQVLETLHQDAQMNDILEELLKTCHAGSSGTNAVPNSPKLMPRGCRTRPCQDRSGADTEAVADFRPVVIDGSNVAMSHGDKKVFSCQGLQLAVNWFWDKGLRNITVFVPMWRKEQTWPEAAITGVLEQGDIQNSQEGSPPGPEVDTPDINEEDQHVLHELESRKFLVYTPSHCVNGKRVVCYDDRYIVKLAFNSDGIIVSNDNYRDLQTESPQWKKFIEERLLMYTFANDKFMPPDDPLGRDGPTIDDFLRTKPWSTEDKMQRCPYGKKCTYGVKCKFYHPERTSQSQLSVADELRDRARQAPPATYQPEHGNNSSAWLTLTAEDLLHVAPPRSLSNCQRDTSSPRSQTSLQHCLSLDVDKAFSSMGSSLSRLYIQDLACSVKHPLHSTSSGVASYGDSSLPGRCAPHPVLRAACYPPGNGSVSCKCSMCSVSRCGAQKMRLSTPYPHQHQQAAWSSCPVAPPHVQQCPEHFGQPSLRQAHIFPRVPLVRDKGTVSPSAEQRKALRSQLSTGHEHSSTHLRCGQIDFSHSEL